MIIDRDNCIYKIPSDYSDVKELKKRIEKLEEYQRAMSETILGIQNTIAELKGYKK